ncbi:hypothetical protein P154DRAFT_237447 [Amniculicola lignicola CBS 123094]|uniref:DUF6590 domain-containing protein n=1 Tax=Amniculicola lignicola CBS 123094 TaxID=1392246 RepID=A0A6A5WAQ1_9PLEO|nr:hypothetical protein P154DRAFT_237447 [Amniculicola lignicola CBS 123094]
MVTYSPWAWSPPHGRHYCYSYDASGNSLGIIWGGPAAPATTEPPDTPAEDKPQDDDDRSKPRTTGENPDVTVRSSAPESPPAASTSYTTEVTQANPYAIAYSTHGTASSQYRGSGYGTSGYASQATPAYTAQSYAPLASPTRTSLSYSAPTSTEPSTVLPGLIQENVGGNRKQRHIKTGPDPDAHEYLDPSYRRVSAHHQSYFFVHGKVFKMLWTEPAGLANPGRTRGSTHFSTIRFGELAFSEIRRFVVIRNCGSFSQCVPVQTYRGRGATKPGLQVQVHGVIHTTEQAPELLENEGITKQPIRVKAAYGEELEAESRINYGKPYAVEHNVKVKEVGDVVDDHKYLLEYYFKNAIEYGQ